MAEKGLRIERKKVAELKYAPYNPRHMSDDMFNKLKNSLTVFGYVEPLVWNRRTGHVVGGNQRLKALKELGVEEVDVVVVDLPLEQEKALNLALNKIVGDWNLPKLKELLLELSETLDSLEITGFDEEEIEKLIGIDPVEETERVLGEMEHKYYILVECDTEEEQKQLIERFIAEGLRCRAYQY